jgi:hypothetical protein
MSTFQQGMEARKTGTGFEARIGDSFEAYAKTSRAFLDFMPLPMTPCGMRHPRTKAPLYIPKGKAPFDIYGFAPQQYAAGTAPDGAAEIVPVAVMVGAECKATGEPETSLAIVKAGTHASGLAQHQLEALALLAKLGGIARVIWDNGGQVGVLKEGGIIYAERVFQMAISAELAGKKAAHGSKSIPWESFEVVDYAVVGGKLVIDWLKF